MVFNPGNKQSGDLLKSEDWNAAMKEIQRLGQAKVNRNGADTLTGPLTIADALNVTGNVGIGTTKPTSEKLEVAGNVKITGARLKNANGWGIIETNQTDWLRINPDQNYPAIALYKAVGINNGGLAVGELTQQPQGVLKVTQSAYLATLGGNVGIGTTSPSHNFHVLALDAVGLFESSGSHAYLRFSTKEGLDNRVEIANRPGGRLSLWTAAGGDVLNITRNGNVGIGTIDPKAKLTVVGTVMISDGTGYAPAQNYMASGSLTIGSLNSNYGGGVNQWNNNTAGLLLETKANTEIAVHDAGLRLASLMYYEGEDINRITIGRDMGWGAISSLKINGDNLITTGAITPSVGNANNRGIMFPTDAFGGSGDAAWMRYYARSGEACTLEIGISNDGDDHIALMPSGNVGIGIHNPQAKLDIAGGLRIRDTSTNGNWMNIYFESGNQTIVFYHQNGLGQFMRQDGNWTRNSDASLKENVSELQGILDKVIQLKPISFLWKGTQMSDIGFVAQDVEQVFPEIVSSRKSEQEGGREIKGLPYSHFGIIAIAAIKEMKKYYDQKIEDIEKNRMITVKIVNKLHEQKIIELAPKDQ